MAYPSVTHTFSNGTTASATQVNQNFTDIINGLSDATKDLSINALTLAGAFVGNGHCTLGNASADDLTINASLASSLAIKTNNSYDIGAATLAPASIYLGAPSSRSTRLRAHQSLGASNTLVFPNGNGNAYQALGTDGSGNLSWQWAPGIYASKNDNYQVLDTDGYGFIDVTVINKTITLPTAADNTNRVITIRKLVSSNGTTTIKGEAAGETVDGITGTTGITLDFYKESVTLICTGSVWEVMEWYVPKPQYTLSCSGTNWTTTSATGLLTKTRESTPVWRLEFNIYGTVSSGSRTTYAVTIANVTFKTITNFFNAIAVNADVNNTAAVFGQGSANTGTGDVQIWHPSATTISYGYSGIATLDSKPSFVV